MFRATKLTNLYTLNKKNASRSFATAKPFDYDVGIVGGGIVGLATARELLLRHPSLKIIVFEKEPQVAQHQSKRNSGVIHSGIYYTPGSKRSKLCVEGLKLMYDYVEKNNLPHKRCGKIIASVKEEELPRMQKLYERGSHKKNFFISFPGVQNGVEGLEIIDTQRILKLEPHLTKAISAIWSPNTGITNYEAVSNSFVKDIIKMGGTVRTNFEVAKLEKYGINKLLESGISVTSTKSGDQPVNVQYLIACAGLYSDRLASQTGNSPSPAVVPFRGEWFKLVPEKQHLVKGLIYPVPDPAFPWLGVHFTIRTDGEVWLGPNAIMATAREGYKFTTFNIKDMYEAFTFRGFQKMFSKYWQTGVGELYRSLNRAAYVKLLQEFVPEIKLSSLQSHKAAGVRALALSEDGALVDDFVFDINPKWLSVLHVRNAPSPAATSSLSIAKEVADLADKAFIV